MSIAGSIGERVPAQIGHGPDTRPLALLKELMDNALAARSDPASAPVARGWVEAIAPGRMGSTKPTRRWRDISIMAKRTARPPDPSDVAMRSELAEDAFRGLEDLLGG